MHEVIVWHVQVIVHHATFIVQSGQYIVELLRWNLSKMVTLLGSHLSKTASLSGHKWH